MKGFFSQVGQMAYRTAALTGFAAGDEQPPYPCASPLQRLDDANDVSCVERLLGDIFAAANDLIENDAAHQWRLVDYKDPEKNGDLRLFTRPRVGPFNFAKVVVSFANVAPQQVLDTLHGEDLESRRRYSTALEKFEILARPTPTSNVQYHEYRGVPLVSSREFVFLSEKKYVAETNVYYVYGCSIDYPPCKESTGCVRASSLWAWRLMPVGSSTLATYVNCMSLGGMMPAFVLDWVKSEAAKELVACRRILYDDIVKVGRGDPENTENAEELIVAS